MSMSISEARRILQEVYGDDREEAEGLCFGDCCINRNEKKALITLLYGPEEEA